MSDRDAMILALRGVSLRYEINERAGAVGCGGLGAMHTLVQRLGLVKGIDAHLQLFKVDLLCHERDHVLNTPYMVMAQLGWNPRAWFALLVLDWERRLELSRMESWSSLQAIPLLPCQIVRRARQIVWRVQSSRRRLTNLLATFERLEREKSGEVLKPT